MPSSDSMSDVEQNMHTTISQSPVHNFCSRVLYSERRTTGKEERLDVQERRAHTYLAMHRFFAWNGKTFTRNQYPSFIYCCCANMLPIYRSSLGWHFVDFCALIYGRDMKSVRGWGLVVPFLNFVPPLLTTEYL